MQYFLIALGSIILFIAILMLLTGGTVQNLVDFFVEKLDDNNTPVHPVKLLQDHPIKLFQKDPAVKTKETPAPQEAVPDKPVRARSGGAGDGGSTGKTGNSGTDGTAGTAAAPGSTGNSGAPGRAGSPRRFAERSA